MKRGETVKLKSGGPLMLVDYEQVEWRRSWLDAITMSRPPVGAAGVGVIWFDTKGELHREEIREDLLFSPTDSRI